MITRFLLIAVSLTAALLAGCSGNDEDGQIRGQYIKGCMSSDIEKDVCACAFDKMVAHYGKEKFRYINQHPTDVPADFDSVGLNSMLVCAGKPPVSASGDTSAEAGPAADQDVSSLNSPGDENGSELSPGAQEIIARNKAASNGSAP